MWKQSTLRLPSQLTQLKCSVIAAHAWIPELGQHTSSGGYLSPLNALEYLGKKLVTSGAGTHNIVMLICEYTVTDLLTALDAASSVFPVPQLKQVRRLAQSFSELEQVKMMLPDITPALPAPVVVATETTRSALNAQFIKAARDEAAAGASISSLKSSLASFASERTGILSGISQGLVELQGKSATAWFFNMKGPALTTAVELVKNLPRPDAVHTAAILFTGSDLSALEAMIG